LTIIYSHPSFNSFLTKQGIKKSLPGAQFVLKPPHEIFEVNYQGNIFIMQGDEFRRFKAKTKDFTVVRRPLKKAKFYVNNIEIENLTFNQLNEVLTRNNIKLDDIENQTLTKYLGDVNISFAINNLLLLTLF